MQSDECCARRITMRKLHKMLLVIVILAAVTVVYAWVLPNFRQDCSTCNGLTCLQDTSVQPNQAPISCIANTANKFAQPNILISLPALNCELPVNEINTRHAMVGPQISTKWHSNPKGVCAGTSLYVPTSPHLYGLPHILTPSVDRILNIPLNRGPTSQRQ